MGRNKTTKEIIELLKKECSNSTQAAVASRIGISASFLSDILRGNRDIPISVAHNLGYKKSIVWVPEAKGEKDND